MTRINEDIAISILGFKSVLNFGRTPVLMIGRQLQGVSDKDNCSGTSALAANTKQVLRVAGPSFLVIALSDMGFTTADVDFSSPPLLSFAL